jgi:DNA mismatch repair protein MutS
LSKPTAGDPAAGSPAHAPTKHRLEAEGLASPTLKSGAPTPMMAQYHAIKAKHPDCLLFFRMGDFFELFFEDAEKASAALGIHLTCRGKHLGEDIPMCGVPVVRAEDYLQKLIAKGFRVAVCEQLEDPAQAKKRGAKAVVERGVVRLVTPGTITEDALLDGRSNNFLTALHADDKAGVCALASLDLSTGDFLIGSVERDRLQGELARLSPREILIADARAGGLDQVRNGAAVTALPQAYFSASAGEAAMKAAFGVLQLDGLGAFDAIELAAIGALLTYVEITQVGKLPAIKPPRREAAAAVMAIDAATRANLELFAGRSGDRGTSLFAAIDRTVTAAGARELARRLAAPLTDPSAIARRLDAVSFWLERPRLRHALRGHLKTAPDADRAVSRLKLGRGGPRDLGLVRDMLGAAAAIRAELEPLRSDFAGLNDIASAADDLARAPGDLLESLKAALADDLPLQARDGGFIRRGFSAELDECLRLARDGRQVMAELQARYAAETGIKSLKVKHNSVLGYFIEVPAAARPLSLPPFEALFRHRQTLAGAMRFTTPDLSETEARMALAGERALAIEHAIFEDLRGRIIAAERLLAAAAGALARLDCQSALAELAEAEAYVRPLVDASLAFEVEGGRHPVVEQALRRESGARFIGNDCRLGEARLWLVTGPNMAGKSTFLRQNALIAILAQMGSFVPANAARIGVIDRLFSRVGASDDLARGRSTFMVEMVETAAILNQASERSFVILDEIGRGTATFDGLSIAWACAEHLSGVNRCRALFATHYHELTTLAGRLPGIANATMAVKEWRDGIVFLHEVRMGAADRSYGIQVAKLAGLPQSVIARARAILAELERGHAVPSGFADDLPLFASLRASEPEPPQAGPSALGAALAEIDPDGLTPREALEALYRLKSLLGGG